MEKRFIVIKNIVLTINLFIFFFLVCIGRNEYIYDMTYSRCIIFMIINSIFIYTYGIFLNKEEVYKSNILIYILLYFIDAPSLRASSSSGLPSMSPTAMTPPQSTLPQSFHPMSPIRRSYQ